MKPLCGAEPHLYDNLASFCMQDYDGPIQILCGVHEFSDPAVTIVGRLMAQFPLLDIGLVAAPPAGGRNRKIANVLNMMPRARHDAIVLSDSDVGVDHHYLRHVIAALAEQHVGLVTCLYRGLPTASFWSRLAAAGIDQHFLPNVLVGLKLGVARPCFGSTIALKAETLRRIGGFQAFADQLADDYAIGAAVRGLGLSVAIPPMVVDHACAEKTFAELVAHELRWARTIRLVDPPGYAGTVVTHAFPFALAAAALRGFDLVSIGVLVLALACRLSIPIEINRVLGGKRVPLWLAPLRDLLSFAIFLASFLPGYVSWRRQRYHVGSDGTLTPA